MTKVEAYQKTRFGKTIQEYSGLMIQQAKLQNLLRNKGRIRGEHLKLVAVAWNSLFMHPDTVVENIAQKYGMSKGDLLEREAADLAVRIALGETRVIAETKKSLTNAGVNVESLENFAAGKTDGVKRSNLVILVKNLPYGSTDGELAKMFGKFGNLEKVVLPLTKTLALVVFLEPADARAAFKGLAYKRYKDGPLYLEWAPGSVLSLSSTAESIEKNNAVLGEQYERLFLFFRYKIGTNESENATAYKKDRTVCLYKFNSIDFLAICALGFVLNAKKRNFLEEADPFIGPVAKICLALNVFQEIPDSSCCVFVNCDMCYCKGTWDKGGSLNSGGAFHSSNIELNRIGTTKVPLVREEYLVLSFHRQKKLPFGSSVHGSFGLPDTSQIFEGGILTCRRMTTTKDHSCEYDEHKKLDAAFTGAKHMPKLEDGPSVLGLLVLKLWCSKLTWEASITWLPVVQTIIAIPPCTTMIVWIRCQHLCKEDATGLKTLRTRSLIMGGCIMALGSQWSSLEVVQP